MEFTNRYRHPIQFSVRVWPRGTRAIKLALAGTEWSVDGMTFNRNNHLEVVHRLGQKGYAAFELTDEDAEKLTAIGNTATARLGTMMLHCPGTNDSATSKVVRLEVNVTVYPNASERTANRAEEGHTFAASREEIPDRIREFYRKDEEVAVGREKRVRPRASAAWVAAQTPREYRGYEYYEQPEVFDVDAAARQILEGKAIVLNARFFTGRMAALIRQRLAYYVVPGRRMDEEGGLYNGYQLGGSVFRVANVYAPERRAECRAAKIEGMHRAVREKGRATRRAYFVGEVVRRVAERFGVSEQRVMIRLVETGIIDYLIRSVETVPTILMREAPSLLRGKVSDAVRVVSFIIEGTRERGAA